MEIGIIGIPRSGKTTIFNALTRGHASVAGYSDKLNIGVAKVPDKRLDVLAEMYRPQKVVQAEITYIDLPPPPEGFGKTRGISGEYLNALQSADALLVVARAFNDPDVAHVDDTVDPIRDADNMLMEMTFSDIEILDRRLDKLKDGFKSAKSQERDLLTREVNILENIRMELDRGVGLRDQAITLDESRRIAGFGFLSAKPVIVVVNVGEGQLSEIESLETKFGNSFSGKDIEVSVFCAQLEMDLVQMDPEDEQEFRDDLGTGESGLSKMVQISYDVVGQISFFTVGEDECRAWEVRRDTVAQEAAGKIHSDLERGFIRAEVMSYEQLVECGNLVEARKRGLLRQEGKDYVLNDGEIMHVLFNV